MRTGHLTGWSRSHRTRIHLAPEPDGRVPRQIAARTSASSSVRKHRQALQLYQMHRRASQFNSRIYGLLGAPFRGVLPLHVLTLQGGRNAATGCCEPPGVHRLPRRIRSNEMQRCPWTSRQQTRSRLFTWLELRPITRTLKPFQRHRRLELYDVRHERHDDLDFREETEQP